MVSRALSVSKSGNTITVDTSGGLVFKVNSNNCDITSMVYSGQECQDQSSGLGSATVSYTTIGNYVKITCETSTLTQYLVAQYKNPAIHMATYTSAEPSVGELRFIARLNRNVINKGYTQSDVKGGTAIEGSDVFQVGGQTHSKFYSSAHFINDQVHGLTGNGNIGAWIIIPRYGYETSSGGPFFRDIDNQGTDQEELYFYMNSNHMQTESYRQGLHGPYVLQFTTGSSPSADVDLDFWETLGDIKGLVKFADRGYVRGTATGVPSGFDITLGWKSDTAQYWVKAGSDGSFTSPKMKPGTYTQTLYKGELEVATKSVTVQAGTTVSASIASTESLPSSYIFKFGEFDGKPTGFLNAECVLSFPFGMIETMHPSDSRMHDWVRTVTISQGASYFPMAVFKDIGPATISATLTSSQLGARTLVIATTSAFAGGRPHVTVNSWSGPNPSAPTQPDSRGVTRGTYLGTVSRLWIVCSNTQTRSLVRGSNTITIDVLSGSSGSQFL
ncbi:rhamnogalacturonase B [Heliocybe sulcata]|uniref:rhamnogalacturonan endolyase n=1 Tax=Heliocybe sulcata TaxID=5364 RepID=A0A5C3MWU9_9AGAM|nr:rhamnogalacturonase B [Heliocybe sulcata]